MSAAASAKAAVAQAAEGQQHHRAQALDRRELVDRAGGLDDELLDHRALAVLLALADAREPVQHVEAERERDRKQELPVSELLDGDLSRDSRPLGSTS